MTAYSIQTVSGNSPDHNESLRNEMIDVLKHSYIFPEKVIDKRFYNLDKIFLLRKANKLLGFCTFTRINLQLGSLEIPSIYLGIMAASPEIQNSGLVLKTMEEMVNNIRDGNPRPGHPQLIWATTASPSSLAIFRRYFSNVSPDDINNIRYEHADLEKSMKKILLQGNPDPGDLPLLVKGIAPLSAYSPQENDRIRAIQRKNTGNIFDKLGIDESQGDRLILIGEL